MEKTEPYVHYLLGKIYESDKKMEEALKHYDVAIENWMPKNDSGDLNKPNLSHMRSRLSEDKAEQFKFLEIAISDPNESQIQPEWPTQYFRLLLEVESPATVQEKSKKYLPKFNKNKEASICARFSLAKSYFNQKDYSKAEPLYWECQKA